MIGVSKPKVFKDSADKYDVETELNLSNATKKNIFGKQKLQDLFLMINMRLFVPENYYSNKA